MNNNNIHPHKAALRNLTEEQRLGKIIELKLL